MTLKPGDLVRVIYSYEHEELEGDIGMIMTEADMVFDPEDATAIEPVYDVHVGEIILCCMRDDLMKISNE